MNFLSHYYHELPCNDAYFVGGLILPDILSNYSYRAGRVVKLHPWRLTEPKTAIQQSLTSGVKRHYAVDAAFHDSDYFTIQTRWIEDNLLSKPFDCFPRRKYAIAHVMLEILLDRSLMVRFPDLTPGFYAKLEEIDEHAIAELMSNNGQEKDAVGVRAHFNEFRRAAFLYDYLNDERLNALLARINRRLGNPLLSASDKQNLTTAIYDIEKAFLGEKFPTFRTDS
ncbi:MAG TPA: hypothetical protein PLL28_10575 [Chitinophagales bacterium]|nr:hypothetical protein [Chitinophagales bacterium]